jgi:hypothetical protein
LGTRASIPAMRTTLRRVPLVSSRAASLRPVPSCRCAYPSTHRPRTSRCVACGPRDARRRLGGPMSARSKLRFARGEPPLRPRSRGSGSRPGGRRASPGAVVPRRRSPVAGEPGSRRCAGSARLQGLAPLTSPLSPRRRCRRRSARSSHGLVPPPRSLLAPLPPGCRVLETRCTPAAARAVEGGERVDPAVQWRITAAGPRASLPWFPPAPEGAGEPPESVRSRSRIERSTRSDRTRHRGGSTDRRTCGARCRPSWGS